MNNPESRLSVRNLAISCILLGSLSFAAAAQEQSTPREMVRTAIQNELQDNSQRSLLFTWKERKYRGRDTEVQRVVQTPEGVLSRVVLIDEKPLNPEQRTAEEERIRKMLDPAQLQRKRRERQEDDQRTNKMLASMPDAFDFQQLDSTQSVSGHKLTRIHFVAHPGFNPPNRESMVFTGMQGEMLLDETAGRLAKIDGTLFKDVTFGWGVLGKLYKGGRFIVEQSEITPGHWDSTKMVLRFEGKALFFKTIHIDDNETSWDYKPVPPMSVEQAVDFLKSDSQSQQNAQLRR
ncbi:MAG TPA: hypothetical protein VM578_01865 [Candidatus Saccharimonadales bacterium]|nr:hypothetical protein [Candidatus Saccharimonadales bacterium]